MTGKVGRIAVGCAGVLIVCSGCPARPTGIASLNPYLGSKPRPISVLPPTRPPPRPVVRNTNPPQQSWTPSMGISDRWRYIVIHHSGSDASTPEGMRDWHVNGRGWKELGYHFVIGNGVGYADGRIYVSARWDKQMHGAHCKTPDNRYNKHGIGICLIGNLEAHAATYKQIESLARLVSFLSREGDISRSQILTHGGVTNRTACPGRYFSLQPVFQRMLMRSVSASSR